MNLVDQLTSTVKPLADVGSRMIGVLKKTIENECQQCMAVESETSGSLHVSYFGYRLVFRIEIKLQRDRVSGRETVTPKLVAYSSDREPDSQEIQLAAFEFDEHGLIHPGGHRLDNFAEWLLLEVFNAAAQNGMTLRP